jgi:hypothetical protein
MESYPLIETSLSATELQFTSFVERHVRTREAVYETEGDGRLPGDTVRMTVTSDDDLSARRHTLEFMSLDGDGHWQSLGCIGHSARQIEARIESTFEIRGADLPHGRFLHGEVEPLVQAQLDMLSESRLLPLRRS